MVSGRYPADQGDHETGPDPIKTAGWESDAPIPAICLVARTRYPITWSALGAAET